MNRQQYIEWHKEHYGYPPKQSFLDKHYPIEKVENEDIPEPTAEEWEEFWREE
jgi:hypothetical protein